MSAADASSKKSKEKENIESPKAKCLSAEVLEKSTVSFLSSQTESPSNIAQVQVLKEILSERNIPDSRETKKLGSLVSHPYTREKVVHQNAVHIFEKDIINFCDISPSTEENLISFSERPSLQGSSLSEHELVNIKTVSTSPMFQTLTAEKDISEPDFVNILKENEKLKHDLKEKLEEIKNLNITCEELKKVNLHKTERDSSKASHQCSMSTQTKITGRKLLDEYGVMKLEKDVKLSDNVEELRGNVFLLLHTIEEKNKELSEVKQSLATVQEDLKKALNTTSNLDKDFYVTERNELYERLASSCSINEELIKHLKSLEKFMEDMLHHEFDSSIESITDKSDFILSVSKCLNESLNLSKILSDNLSICEGSRLFEDCESFLLKNGNYSEEKDLPHLGLDTLSMLDQLSHCEYISHLSRNNVRVGKESDSSQLCWRCWQQLNPTVDQTEGFHLMQNSSIPKPAGYQSSDSDIWSEPDRNVSMQRIGINLQNSPVSLKSPRKSKQKDKRMSTRISSKEDTSSSDLQAFKKRQGSASRRLFAKDTVKVHDFAFDNFYFLVAEKYSKLKSLIDDLESIKDAKLSDDGWIRINNLVCAVGETLHKLHFAKENIKTSPVCGKCLMLELFSNLKASYVETDFFIGSTSFEQKVLQEFSRELCALKDTCKKPFSLFYETVDKNSVATQSDILNECEQIKELESIIKSMTEKNVKMDERFKNVQQMLTKEKEELFSAKAENSNLLNEIDNLKIDLVDLRYREKELLLKNEKLTNDLNDINKNNSDLKNTMKNIEQQKKELSNALDKLNTELEEKRSDVIQMSEICLELEKQLNEQIYMTENSENKFKKLEAESFRERSYYLSKIDDLTTEKNLNISELKSLQEKRITLEKENAVLNDRLQSKNNELSSLRCTIEQLKNIKETQDNIENVLDSSEKIALETVKTENFRLLEEVNKLKNQLLNLTFKEKELSLENKKLIQELDHASKNNSKLNNRLEDLDHECKESTSKFVHVKDELEKNKLDLAHINKKCQDLEKKLDEQIQIKEKYENKLKTLKLDSLSEKESFQNQLNSVNAENKFYEQQIKSFQEKILILEKENATLNFDLDRKHIELLSLKTTVERLQRIEVLTCDNEEAKLLSKNNESTRTIEIKNSQSLSCNKELEEELSHMKMTEEKLLHKNEKLNQELASLAKNNSELANTLNAIEEKNKKSEITLNKLTSELQKNKSDLIHMNEKCIEYEKQLNEQICMRKNSESKLKNLEYESHSEKNYYLRKIDDLNAEKEQYILELNAVQEKRLHLEKENAVINDRLQSKNNELLSLKATLSKLQSVKETHNDIENEAGLKERVIVESLKTENVKLSSEVNNLKEQVIDFKYKEKEFSLEKKKLVEELNNVNKNYSELDSMLEDLKRKYNESASIADQLKAEMEKNRLDFSYMEQKCQAYEEKIDNLNCSLKDAKDKNTEFSSAVDHLKAELHKYKLEKNSYVQELENIKIENLKLVSHIKQLEKELSVLKNKEKELYLKNKKLVEELDRTVKDNAELHDSLKALERKKEDSIVALDHLTSDVQKSKSNLIHMSQKCLEYEKQLNEQKHLKEKYENELKSQESKFLNEKIQYSNQINELKAGKEHCIQKLKITEEKKLILEKEIATVNDSLQSKNNEIIILQKTIEELQQAKETSNSKYEKLCSELKNKSECLTNLLDKHEKCEEIIMKSREVESDYSRQLKQLEAKSLSEKEKLLNEISVLTKEREDILQKLREEKECYEGLKSENTELNEKYMNVFQQISILKQRNGFFENALHSSNKECDSLSKDLKCLRNTLQNLESKCLMYEKQIVATVGIKDRLTECLLNINKEFSIQRQKLNEMCKLYGNDGSVVWDESSFTKLITDINEDNVSKLCESIISETKELSQSVEKLLLILKNYHVKFVEMQTSEEKHQTKSQSLKKKIELHKAEVSSAHLQNDHFQHIIEELQKSISEKEESLHNTSYEVGILKEKLKNSHKEIDRKSQLVERKDDEITKLQERIFDLQTFVNNIMTDKKNMLENSTSMTEKTVDSVSSSNQLTSKLVSTESKMCQTEEWECNNQNLNESFTSISSFESGKNHCCEKYWKKCYSLQTKLAFCQKHIEILEKSKNDLKERLLQQLQNKKDSDEKSGTAVTKLIDLESKLEKKKLFIIELKSDLLKTCNSLIDKEKELDDLKQKLAECEVKLKCETLDASKVQPKTILSSVDANVKTLKNHKWKLIQTIFDIQRKIYEKKGIHLNYFDKFKEHVNNLYSLQLIPSISKSESMPLLRSYALKEHLNQGNEKVKKLADLELDIECLENLKIFLNRFLVPHVFQRLETSDKEIDTEQNVVSSDPLPSPVRTENKKESKHKISDILNLSFPEAFITTEKENDISTGVLTSTICQHLEYIENFLNIITKINWLDIRDLSVEDSVDNSEMKSLLLKIFHEINILQKGANKLFNLNTQLKSCDFVAPLSTTKFDTSDRESIMSEETIAVSRTESPLSFEDTCPIKLPHPETLQLEENTLKTASVRNRVTVIEPYGSKVTAVDGSCDSVCQRSHYSSPDLGIESDPNHDSSAPEHKDDDANKYQVFPYKLPQVKTAFTSAESAGRWPGPTFGDTFYAISTLTHFEHLKQEIKESLVAIKSVLSRTGDGLHHIAKYTSPRKTLEYNTLKSIKDTCIHMEVCLKEANNLIGEFWTAPCPTEKEWKILKEENQKLSDELLCLRALVEKQEVDFKKAMGNLQRAQAVKDNIEKKISKKLVKTKKLIRRTEIKLLETGCQNFLPVPKYPSEQTEQAEAH